MIQNMQNQIQLFVSKIEKLKAEIGKVIVGNNDVVNTTLIGLMAGGNVFLEGVPGIGKTLLVRSIARCLGLHFNRIQFTPDLMPADILGTNIITENDQGRRVFEFQKGPIFSNLVLADEINRATPKTQSALLEAMAEQSVTISGNTHRLEKPFFVLATQNPIEMEGTYPLPEAQLDRFMFKVEVLPGTADELKEVLRRTTSDAIIEVNQVMNRDEILQLQCLARAVPVADELLEFVSKLVLATHPQSEFSSPIAKKYLRYGSSPRGAQAIIMGAKVSALMAGRPNVSQNDLDLVMIPSLSHRLIRNFEAEAEGLKTAQILVEIRKYIKNIV